MTRPRWASAGAWGLAFAISVLLATSPPSGADPGDEAALLAQTAAARAQLRLGPVTRSADLDVVARRHAQRLAAAPGPAFHNPSLQAETPGWSAIGEVVGRIPAGAGWDRALVQLFLASPAHRGVILSAGFNAVGVGTARSPAGVISAVEVFGRGAGGPVPPRASRQQQPRRPAPPPPATPAAAPLAPALTPTTTTTTTTTTTPPPPATVPPVPLPALRIAVGTGRRDAPSVRGWGATAAAGLLAACTALGWLTHRGPRR